MKLKKDVTFRTFWQVMLYPEKIRIFYGILYSLFWKTTKVLKYEKKILVFSAHPDDETLGCGGYIKKLSKINNSVVCIFSTG